MSPFFKITNFAILKVIYFQFETPNKQMMERRRDMEYFYVFSPNVGKYGPEN